LRELEDANMNSKKTIQDKFKEALDFKYKKEIIEFEAEMIHLDIMHEIQYLMDKYDINRTQLAKFLNVTKGYITQLFSGDKLINLKTLAKIQRIFKIKFSFEYETLTSLRTKKPDFEKPDFRKPSKVKVWSSDLHSISKREVNKPKESEQKAA